jgi:predicted DNA-binding transcriptional regulator YafY
MDAIPEPLLRERGAVTFKRPEDLAVVLVGALALREVAGHGQTKLFARAIDSVIEQVSASLEPRAIMKAEVEAYDVLDWLVGGDALPNTEADRIAKRRDDGVVVFDPDAPIAELILRAIDEGFDLKIDYFSRSRGELNTRRISPKKLEAETYLDAYCHARRADRVFRLNRITRCQPVMGRPIQPRQHEAASSEQATVPIQGSLLEE